MDVWIAGVEGFRQSLRRLQGKKKEKKSRAGSAKRPFPGREDLRHFRHQESEASRGGADVPWIAYAYSGGRSNEKDNVYIYVSGTSFVRQAEELAGCSGEAPDKDPNTALFRIEVIKVPVAAPQDAKVVSSPRLFIDPRTGAMNGLNNGGTHGKKGSEKPADTNQCHDITVYSAIGLAAGACSGNGILLDIKDPVHPKRVDAVNDPNYSYWHSASFSNDGTKVVFTDEMGGGLGARCRPNDRTSGRRCDLPSEG